MLLAALLLTATAPLPDRVEAQDCQYDTGWIVRYNTDPFPIRQGDSVTIGYSRTHGPDGEYAFSPKCLKKWTITDKRVKISRDRYRMTVSPDIPAGTQVTIEAKYGKDTFRLRFTVLGRDDVSLIGRWSMASRQNCPGRGLAELGFSATRFFYTFPQDMVESMSSGSGDYRWDQKSGEMLLGANLDKPGWRGTATFARGVLTLEGIAFDGEPVSGTCRMTFVRY